MGRWLVLAVAVAYAMVMFARDAGIAGHAVRKEVSPPPAPAPGAAAGDDGAPPVAAFDPAFDDTVLTPAAAPRARVDAVDEEFAPVPLEPASPPRAFVPGATVEDAAPPAAAGARDFLPRPTVFVQFCGS